MSLQSRIQDVYPEFTQSEKQLADYFLNHLQEVSTSSAKDLAEKVGTSAPTIVRFSRTLGYSGFPALKMDILMSEKSDVMDLTQELTENETVARLVSTMYSHRLATLDHVRGLIDEATTEKAVAALCKANTVYLCGIGGSSIVCQDFQQKLSRIGIRTIHVQDAHVMMTMMTGIQEGDVLVAVSYSGETKEVIETVRIAKEKNATVLSISQLGKTSLNFLICSFMSQVRKTPSVQVLFPHVTALCSSVIRSIFPLSRVIWKKTDGFCNRPENGRADCKGATIVNLATIETEVRNVDTMDIDHVSALEIVEKINREDHKIADAVALAKNQIAEIIENASSRLKEGGRIIYIGAGTSGRLGVLDASECPPTYGVSADLVMGLIAGGEDAMFKAKEGAEDDPDLAVEDLKKITLCSKDTVIGLAASGRTPYVIGGLDYACSIGAYTASVSCVSNAVISGHAQTAVEVITGPEAVTGSTRMKAGTAQKMVCNMISTGCMIRYGKVNENLMVDVQPTNEKLVERAGRIISQATGCDIEKAHQLLEESGRDVKIAIIMGCGNISADEACACLDRADGNVHDAIVAAKEKK